MRRVRDENVGWLSFRDIDYCEIAVAFSVALLLRIAQIHVTCTAKYVFPSFEFLRAAHNAITLLELKQLDARKILHGRNSLELRNFRRLEVEKDAT